MEKISTGASTDSDLRVITIDCRGEMVKPIPKIDLEADDSVPKFRKPGVSKQTHKPKPAPQFLMFENYRQKIAGENLSLL